MRNEWHDILMITYNRPAFTKLALEQLLKTCDENMRVWIWHNGTDQETLDVVEEFRAHPKLYHIHVSPENKKLREPTNWFWANSDGAFLSKVDDDCLLPMDWAKTLREAHTDEPKLGVVGCWRFYDSDFVPELAEKKIRTIGGGHRIMRHHHVQGSGYVMKRAVFQDNGPLRNSEGFTRYCNRAGARGWEIGWYFPFIHEEHMDGARSPYYPYKTDDEFMKYRPLTAINAGVRSVEEWKTLSAKLAHSIQEDLSEAKSHVGWRRVYSAGRRRLSSLLGSTGHIRKKKPFVQ